MNINEAPYVTVGTSALKSTTSHIIDFSPATTPDCDTVAQFEDTYAIKMNLIERIIYHPVTTELRMGSIRGYSVNKASSRQSFLVGVSFFAFALAAVFFGY